MCLEVDATSHPSTAALGSSGPRRHKNEKEAGIEDGLLFFILLFCLFCISLIVYENVSFNLSMF